MTMATEGPAADGGHPPTADEIETVLAQRVRPYINAHAGDVHVLEVSRDGDVHLAFDGACGRCPALNATFAISVLPVLRSVPGVRRVSADGVRMSDAALQRVSKMFGPTTHR